MTAKITAKQRYLILLRFLRFLSRFLHNHKPCVLADISFRNALAYVCELRRISAINRKHMSVTN